MKPEMNQPKPSAEMRISHSAGAKRAVEALYQAAMLDSLGVAYEAEDVAEIIDRETGKWLIEWAKPSFDAGLSSAVCCGCHSPNEPGVVLEGGYGRGYWLLSSKGINHPWHASCASKALGEFEDSKKP